MRRLPGVVRAQAAWRGAATRKLYWETLEADEAILAQEARVEEEQQAAAWLAAERAQAVRQASLQRRLDSSLAGECHEEWWTPASRSSSPLSPSLATTPSSMASSSSPSPPSSSLSPAQQQLQSLQLQLQRVKEEAAAAATNHRPRQPPRPTFEEEL
eukprot:COSAG01_NODE_4232_length_5222_cov_3.643959_3_plen_157_part_00